MAEFTMFLVVGFPGPWPFAQSTNFAHFESPDGIAIDLFGHADGHLELAVGPKDLPPTVMHFQRLVVPGPNLNSLVILHGDGPLQCDLNGTSLLTLSEANGDSVEVPLQVIEQSPNSFDVPDAPQACHEWVTRRARSFAEPAVSGRAGERRQKSLAEQVHDLSEALGRIEAYIESARSGQLEFVPALAGELRALLYWPRGARTRTWNPLLLRLGNEAEMALPVFAHISDGSEPDVVKAASYHALGPRSRFSAGIRDRS
jgi:hypothetical protein